MIDTLSIVGTPPAEDFQEQAKHEESQPTVVDGQEVMRNGEQELEIAPEQTEQHIDIPAENSLDSMEGVPENPSESSPVADFNGAASDGE